MDAANMDTFEKVTVSREVLQSFGSFRSRGNRSVSSESSRSKISEPGSENHEDLAVEDGFSSIQHPSPVYESDSNDLTDEAHLDDHAQKLNGHLEVASTFGKVSSLRVVDSAESKKDQNPNPKSITSFHAKHAINLHITPKIRRASSPCVTFAPQFYSKFDLSEKRFSLALKTPETLLENGKRLIISFYPFQRRRKKRMSESDPLRARTENDPGTIAAGTNSLDQQSMLSLHLNK